MPEHGFVATQPQRLANAKDLNFENVLRLGFATAALRLRCGPKEFVLIRVHSWLQIKATVGKVETLVANGEIRDGRAAQGQRQTGPIMK